MPPVGDLFQACLKNRRPLIRSRQAFPVISGNARTTVTFAVGSLCFFVLLWLLFTCAAPVRADVSVEASYSEPANLFSLMDNVSGWLPEFTDAAYRDEWARRFGWSKSDQAWVNRYSEYRHRTYYDPSEGKMPATSVDGLFARSAANTAVADPLATYFLSQRSLNTALVGFNKVATRSDARMLEGFYQHFAPEWRTVLAESNSLSTNSEALNRQLHSPRVAAFAARAARFYRAPVDGSFQAFFVWFPPGRRASAEVVAGRYFLIHIQPGEDISERWDGIALHELMHYISAHQSASQKQALTKQFLARCPQANGPKALRLLEEPLAVAWGQAAYEKYVRGQSLDWNESWYSFPQVDILGHLLWPDVDRLYSTDATITDGIVVQAAKNCASLFAAGRALSGLR